MNLYIVEEPREQEGVSNQGLNQLFEPPASGITPDSTVEDILTVLAEDIRQILNKEEEMLLKILTDSKKKAAAEAAKRRKER